MDSCSNRESGRGRHDAGGAMSPVPALRDTLSEQGARRLCRRIEAYWARRRGRPPRLRVALSGAPPGAREGDRYHVVRSDMVNDRPAAGDV